MNQLDVQGGRPVRGLHRGRLVIGFALCLAVVVVGCSRRGNVGAAGHAGATVGDYTVATFAGGCFWCMEAPFEEIDGVRDVVSGYTGGRENNPSYEQVSSGATGHREAVRVLYDPRRVTYAHLLDIFWRQIDPTDEGGQFVDRGRQYRTAIFYHDEVQRRLAERSRAALARSGRFDRPIVTEILPAGVFYAAEEYHQDYHRKNPIRYGYYRRRSGRDQFLTRVWRRVVPASSGPVGKNREGYVRPSDEELRERLDPMQYRVTRENATEAPFRNAFWDNKREGIYVDVVSGEPLFSSTDKFASGTGWPSFTRPLDPVVVAERQDGGYGMRRTEVRSAAADNHLGHVFADGPAPTGKRYCINSAALRFVAKENLEKEGYGQYLTLFER